MFGIHGTEPCYEGLILQRNNRKITIWEPRPGHVIPEGLILQRNNRKITIWEPRPGHVITKTML